MEHSNLLMIFGGLPGTGKTAIAKELAKHLKAIYLRVDTVEQVLKNISGLPCGPEGYLISYAVAKENLRLGLNVVADSVNSITVTRRDWQEVAKSSRVQFLEIEITCSDLKEHQKKVESRIPDIVGHELPTWKKVKSRDYEKWDSATLKIDTAKCSIDDAVNEILKHIQSKLS